MGKLCEEIYEMSPHPNKAIAIATGFAMIAGIVGRQYNVSGLGLNIYLTVLAQSGIGKSVIKDSINKALVTRKGGKLKRSSYLAPTKFTSGSSVYQCLKKTPSCLSIMEEAGMLRTSKGPEWANVTRVLLDIYSSSGKGKFACVENSEVNNDKVTPLIESPAFSLIQISSPQIFIKEVRKKASAVTGELARMWVLRSFTTKSKFNRNMRENYSEEVYDTISNLMAYCSNAQNLDNEFIPDDLAISNVMYKDADSWVELENEYLESGDIYKQTMCSRAWVKTLKIASIASVFNGKSRVGVKEYKWAQQMVSKELIIVNEVVQNDVAGQLKKIVKEYMYNYIVNILNGNYSGSGAISTPEMAEKGIITRSAILQTLIKKSYLEVFKKENFGEHAELRDVADLILDYMVNEEYISFISYIEIKKYGNFRTGGYRVLPKFWALKSN